MKVRLPPEYKMKDARRAEVEVLSELKAERKTRERMREYDSFAIEMVILSMILTLIEDEGYGYGPRSVRIRRVLDGVTRRIRGASERYDEDCTLEALRHKVSAYGLSWSFT